MTPARATLDQVLARPPVRSLLGFLAATDEPIRARSAREALELSIAQTGLAIRALERHGLAIRRAIAVEEPDGRRPLFMFFEATEAGREHARRIAAPMLVVAGAVPPAPFPVRRNAAGANY